MGSSLVISRWKQIYGTIYNVGVLGKTYIVRPLTESEYTVLWGGASSLERDNRIFSATTGTVDAAVLDPTNVLELIEQEQNHPGGLVDALCSAILQVSQFGNNSVIDEKLKEYRSVTEITVNILKDYIIAAELGYTLIDLENMTLDKICELTAHAEQVTTFRQIQRQKALAGEEPHVIEFLTPKEVMKRKVEREMQALQPSVERIAQEQIQQQHRR
jgi:hypothetical protein